MSVFFDDRADFRKSCFCIGQPPKIQCIMIHAQLSKQELGDCLGSLRDSMLGELTGEHKSNSGLDFMGLEGCLLVVGGKLSSFAWDALKDITDEGVHNAHSLLVDACVWVDLLEHLVDVGGVGFGALLATLLLSISGGFDNLGRCLLGGCLGHSESLQRIGEKVGRAESKCFL